MQNKQAFTLIELLVVVLIIGVLTAVALPMYQGVVDKSHWSTMLPGAKAIKDAEEAIKMTNGTYTGEMEHLDVTMNNSDLTFALLTPNNTADPNVIRVTNSKLPNVRLASYLEDSPKFAGQLHCEAKTGDERAERLCGKLLNGQDLTSADGYTGYLLDQEIDKATCDHVSRAWSNKNTKCFRTEQDRCKANGMPYNNATNLCGYKGRNGTEDNKLLIDEGAKCVVYSYKTCSHLQVEEGGVCEASGSGCQHSEFKEGSKCISLPSGDYACLYSSFSGATCEGGNSVSCAENTFSNGSTCIGNGETSCGGNLFSDSKCIGNGGNACKGGTYNNSVCEANAGVACAGSKFQNGGVCLANAQNASPYLHPCYGSTFKTGSKCVANAPGTCATEGWRGTVTYDGGCCEGPYCPSNAPKC